ncbi:MAG TPA: hypothetical protein VN841_11810 [Bryobacteraceae bacterium]|nr:hypothetical protein [Bryobacteraceae bacterium]
MASLNPRSKSVIFRITTEEYEFLKSELAAHGARSISDLARSRVLRGQGDPLLAQVGRKLDDLESAVQHLAAAIKSS